MASTYICYGGTCAMVGDYRAYKHIKLIDKKYIFNKNYPPEFIIVNNAEHLKSLLLTLDENDDKTKDFVKAAIFLSLKGIGDNNVTIDLMISSGHHLNLCDREWLFRSLGSFKSCKYIYTLNSVDFNDDLAMAGYEDVLATLFRVYPNEISDIVLNDYIKGGITNADSLRLTSFLFYLAAKAGLYREKEEIKLILDWYSSLKNSKKYIPIWTTEGIYYLMSNTPHFSHLKEYGIMERDKNGDFGYEMNINDLLEYVTIIGEGGLLNTKDQENIRYLFDRIIYEHWSKNDCKLSDEFVKKTFEILFYVGQSSSLNKETVFTISQIIREMKYRDGVFHKIKYRRNYKRFYNGLIESSPIGFRMALKELNDSTYTKVYEESL